MKTLLLKPKTASLFANGFSALIAIASFSFLTRLFDSEELTFWTFFISFSALYTMLNRGLIDVYFVKKWNESKILSKRNKLMGSAWQLDLMVLLITLIIFISLYLYFQYNASTSLYDELMLLLMIFIFLDAPYRRGVCKLSANLEYQKILNYKVLEQSLFFGGISCLFIYKNYVAIEESLFKLLGVLFLVIRLITSLLTILFGDSGISGVKHGTRSQRKEILGFGGYTAGTQAVNSLLSDSDFYIIHAMRGSLMSSIFVVAKKAIPFINLAMNSIAQVSYSKIARVLGHDKEELYREYHREFGILLVFIWPLCIVAFLFAEKIIYIIGGIDYVGSIPVFRAMVVCMFLAPIDKMLGVALNLCNMPRVNFHKMLIMLGVNICGDAFVLYLGGDLVDVAYVTIASFLAGIVYNYMFLRKLIEVSIFRVLIEGYLWVSHMVKRK